MATQPFDPSTFTTSSSPNRQFGAVNPWGNLVNAGAPASNTDINVPAWDVGGGTKNGIFGATGGMLTGSANNPFSDPTLASPVPERNVNIGGTNYWQVPGQWGLGGGLQKLTPGAAGAAGGTAVPDAFNSYLFPSSVNPETAIQTGVPSGSYTPGRSGKSITEGDILGVASGAGLVAGGYFAAPYLFGAAGAAGGLAGAAGGGIELPAGTAASGLPLAGGSSVIAPAVGEQAAAGAALTAAGTGTGGLFPAAASGGLTGQLAVPASATGGLAGLGDAGAGSLTGAAATSGGTGLTLGQAGGAGLGLTAGGLTATGAGGTAAAGDGGLLGAGGVLGTGLTGGQAAVLGGGLAAGLLLGGRQIPQSGYLTNEQQTQSAQGQQLIQNAINGQLTPGQQAQLDEWKNSQMATAKQYLINSGQGTDSTAMLGLQANIDQQAIAISQGFLDQSFQQGISELGIADSATAQLIQGRLIQQQAISNSLSNFMMSYSLLAGWGNA